MDLNKKEQKRVEILLVMGWAALGLILAGVALTPVDIALRLVAMGTVLGVVFVLAISAGASW